MLVTRREQPTLNKFLHSILSPGWGAHSHWKQVWGCVALKTLFSGHFLALKTYHFKPFSSSRDTTSVFGKKKCNFNLHFHRFWLNFSSRDTNFSEKSFRRTQFQVKKISFGDPTFENLGGTYLPKFFFSTPSILSRYMCNCMQLGFACLMFVWLAKTWDMFMVMLLSVCLFVCLFFCTKQKILGTQICHAWASQYLGGTQLFFG